jgi:hypothetical protein
VSLSGTYNQGGDQKQTRKNGARDHKEEKKSISCEGLFPPLGNACLWALIFCSEVVHSLRDDTLSRLEIFIGLITFP